MNPVTYMPSACKLFLILITLHQFAVTTEKAIASPVTAKADLASPALAELERSVWLATGEEYAALEKRIVRILQDNPYSAFGHYLLAQLMLRDFAESPQNLDTLRRASDLAQQAVELSPTSDFGYITLAEVLDLIGQAPKATELLSTSMLQGMEPSWRTYFTLARMNAEHSSAEKVFAYFEQALASKDSFGDVIVPYVIAMIENSTSNTSRLQQLIDWNNRFPHLMFKQSIAISMAENGQFESAHKLYDSLSSEHPDFHEARLNNAIIMYRHMGKLDQAFQTLQQLLDIQPHASDQFRFMVKSHMGVIRLKQRQPSQAEDYFFRSSRLANEPLAFIDFIDRQYRENGQEKQLSSLYKRFTTSMPGIAMVHAMLGETLTQVHGNFEGAIESFSNAILLEPQRSEYYNGMGIAYYRMAKYQEALQVFSSAIKVDPADAVARYNQACMLARLGRAEHALASLKEALMLNPGLANTALADDDFASLRQSRQFMQLVFGSDRQMEDFESTTVSEELAH